MFAMRISAPNILALALTLTSAAASVVGCGDSDPGGSVSASGDTGSVSATNGADTDSPTSSASHATIGGSGGGDEGEGGVCSSADFEAQVIAFCKAQNPPEPGPGELGATCASDMQCDSDICLEPFGSPYAYCSIPCPKGDECPIAFSCQDTGTSLGPACYQGVCIYGGTDASDCTTRMLAELDEACSSECTLGRIEGWMDCIAGAGRLCGPEDADAHCGIERGLLEDCCSSCDSIEL